MAARNVKRRGKSVAPDPAPEHVALIVGEVLECVSRAVLEVEAGEVLVLRLVRFDMKDGTLPAGVTIRGIQQGG